jgi:hypothetical protein
MTRPPARDALVPGSARLVVVHKEYALAGLAVKAA